MYLTETHRHTHTTQFKYFIDLVRDLIYTVWNSHIWNWNVCVFTLKVCVVVGLEMASRLPASSATEL